MSRICYRYPHCAWAHIFHIDILYLMEKRKTLKRFLDYGSIVASFLIFMSIWPSHINLHAGKHGLLQYKLLLMTTLLVGFSVLAIFAVLEIHKHQRIAVVFSVLLLILGIPFVLHRSFDPVFVTETVALYAKNIYIPLLASSSLFLLVKHKNLWQSVLRWSMRIYAVFGVIVGTIILYANIAEILREIEGGLTEHSSGIITMLAIGLIVVVLIIMNPLYLAWRTSSLKNS